MGRRIAAARPGPAAAADAAKRLREVLMPAQRPVPAASARVAAILAGLVRPGPASGSMAERLCAESVRMLDISGAGLILMNDQENLGVVAVTDGPAAQMEELQFATGEGPCVEQVESADDLGQYALIPAP